MTITSDEKMAACMEALQRLEWAGSGGMYCLICRQDKEDNHKKDCSVRIALYESTYRCDVCKDTADGRGIMCPACC